MIPYGHQDISEDDIEAVVSVLRSDFLTQGPAVPAFEKCISNYCGSQFSIAVNSATSALHLACLALEVGPGDIVWTSAITFVASANCALYCGANVDFVDIDPRSYNMSVESLREKLEYANKIGNLPKVVIPVHLCGQSCDMESIYLLSEKYGFKIIEDASHAIGGRYKDQPVGNCLYSDISVFSFHPVKIITTGEGGLATTNNLELAERMQLLRSHGITREKDKMSYMPDGPWYYEQIALGFNYRMTDIQAALGLSQMERLDFFVTARHDLASRYDALLDQLPLLLPWCDPHSYSALHLYVIRLDLDEIKKTHLQVFEELRESGIGVNLHYMPVYRQPYYQKMGFKNGYCPNAEQYYQEAISLPIFPGLANEDHDKVIAALDLVTGSS
jgi:UDP-4-amino-4,6-dideoxy-N-acetyl-beta-L-altrosamine transaminase